MRVADGVVRGTYTSPMASGDGLPPRALELTWSNKHSWMRERQIVVKLTDGCTGTAVPEAVDVI